MTIPLVKNKSREVGKECRASILIIQIPRKRRLHLHWYLISYVPSLHIFHLLFFLGTLSGAHLTLNSYVFYENKQAHGCYGPKSG